MPILIHPCAGLKRIAPLVRCLLLACCAWCLLCGAAFAHYDSPDDELDETIEEEVATGVDFPETRLFDLPDGSSAITHTSGKQDSSVLIWRPSQAAKPKLVAAEGSSQSLIPRGMIPYFGGRTPDSEKDRGIGEPLEGRGWRNRPFSISGFAGITDGNALIPGHVLQQASPYAGFNLGWDYDHYWGIEKRLGFGALNLTNGHHDAISSSNFSITGEYRLMYYPLGDARWRPFLTTGLGWSDFYFRDDLGDKHLDTVGMFPYGLGLKYLYNDRVALRVDLVDELTFGAGSISTFHYVALTAGLEVRYGRRLLKMPWHKAETN